MQAGDPIVLHLVLGHLETNRFVRARLKAPDGSLWKPDPIPMAGNGDGTYSYFHESALVFPPDVFEIRAVYEIFRDAGYTERDITYNAGEDIYRYDTASSHILEEIEKLKAQSSSFISLCSENVIGIVDDESVIGIAREEDIEEIVGIIFDDEEVHGVINSLEETIIGSIEDEDITGLA